MEAPLAEVKLAALPDCPTKPTLSSLARSLRSDPRLLFVSSRSLHCISANDALVARTFYILLDLTCLYLMYSHRWASKCKLRYFSFKLRPHLDRCEFEDKILQPILGFRIAIEQLKSWPETYSGHPRSSKTTRLAQLVVLPKRLGRSCGH